MSYARRSAHSYAGWTEEDELGFVEGDLITLTRASGNWWTGTDAAGTVGNFPSNYVQVVE